MAESSASRRTQLAPRTRFRASLAHPRVFEGGNMNGSELQTELVKQLETYSNAIVAFAVLQSLAYSYSFGTSELFNCLVKTASYLALGLTLAFTLVTTLMVIALMFIGRTMQSFAGEYSDLVRKVIRGKLVAVVVASLMPIALTFSYGVLDYPAKYKCLQSVPGLADAASVTARIVTGAG